MSIIEIKIFTTSHCANFDPTFFISAFHTFLIQILVIQKKNCEISDNSSA